MRIFKIMALAMLCMAYACNENTDFQLPEGDPEVPAFSYTDLADGTNTFVFKNESQNALGIVWDFGSEARPSTSTLDEVLVQFPTKGTYVVTLHLADANGTGTNFKRETIVIAEDAELGCDGTLSNFTNECMIGCWQFAGDPDVVKVGPTPLNGEWFTSNGLEPTQNDDIWCFDGEGFLLDYQNQGSSFSSCQGFVEDTNYPVASPSESTWQFIPAGGIQGTDRIILDNPIAWWGTEDSGPFYDIFEIDGDIMTVVTPIEPCDGSESPGFFTYTMVRVQ